MKSSRFSFCINCKVHFDLFFCCFYLFILITFSYLYFYVCLFVCLYFIDVLSCIFNNGMIFVFSLLRNNKCNKTAVISKFKFKKKLFHIFINIRKFLKNAKNFLCALNKYAAQILHVKLLKTIFAYVSHKCVTHNVMCLWRSMIFVV